MREPSQLEGVNMRIHLKVALVAIALAVCPWFITSAEACTCTGPMPPCQEYGAAAAVFTGTVIDISTVSVELGEGERKHAYNKKLVRFSVEQAFRGTSGSEVEIATGSGGGDCGYHFEQGKQYIVYAYNDSESKRLGTGICTRTRLLRDAAEDLAYIRGLATAAPGARIFGKVERRIMDARRERSISSGPAAGIKVLIEGQGRRFEVVTNNEGLYEVTGVPAGTYEVRLILPEQLSAYHEPKVEVRDRGCAQADLTVTFDGRIGGRVLDSSGQPVAKIPVELVVADSVGGAFSDVKGEAVYSDDEGRYEFKFVPPGRYLLGVSIKMPPDDRTPYTRTYFPGVSDSANAAVIGMGEGTKQKDYDLRLPPKATVREIKGIVLWSDGYPAGGALVSLDLPDYPGWLKMMHAVSANSKGNFLIKGLEGLKYSIHASSSIEKNGRQYYVSAQPVDAVVSERMGPVKLVLKLP